MTAHVLDLLPKEVEDNLTPEQAQIMHLIQGHVTLQSQFEQLTKHVEACYREIERLSNALANKVLS